MTEESYSITHLPSDTTALDEATLDEAIAFLQSKGAADYQYHITEWSIPEDCRDCPEAWSINFQLSGDEFLHDHVDD